jgi:glyoxylase-like metal-dependent hydrolase (beta-lactamase superfamily II)
MMKALLPGIWQWSWFSDEKKLDFNGVYLSAGEHHMLVDPPPMDEEDVRIIKRAGGIDYIIITNRDHEREAARYRVEFGCQVYVPQADAPLMSLTPTKTFADGELLPGGIWVIHLKDQKSPGESALFIQQGRGILIVGDALVGVPGGTLRLLPAEKYQDASKAKEGLKRLLKYTFDSILVGDGVNVMTDAKSAVERALQ